MSLRKKTLVIIGLTMLGLIGIVYILARHSLMANVNELEEREIRRNSELAQNTLNDELTYLGTISRDWAAWDDTYAFIFDRNEAFIQSNVVDVTFTGLDINLMVFLDTSGQVVYARAFDLHSQRQVPIPAGIESHLSPGSPLLDHPDPESVRSGILTLGNELWLVSSSPIVTSGFEGPIRGVLLFGRLLDEARLQQLADSSRLSLSIIPFQEAKSRLPLPKGDPPSVFLYQRVDGQTMMGYSLVSDVYGVPTFYLGIKIPRDIYRNSQTSILVLSLAVLASGILFGGVLLVIMERLVLARVEKLSKSVNQISESGDSSIRVEMSGTDELARLASTINRTMDSLQRSEQALMENEERYRAIIDAQVEFICRWREGGILTFANDAYCAYYGIPRQQLIGSNILSRVHPGDHDRIKAYLASLGPDNPRGEVERRVITPDGQVRWHQWTDQAIFDELGKVTEFQSTGRDITERKLAQEELYRRAEELAALHEISLDINAHRELPSLLHTIVKRAVILLGGTGGGMYLCEPDRQQVRCVVSYQTPQDFTGTTLQYGEDAAGIVARTGQPLIIADYSAWSEKATLFGNNPEIKSVISVPMIWQGQVTGVIQVLHSTQPGLFTQRYVELLSLLANQAAIAVENAILYEDAQRRAREAETLRQAGAAVVATLDQNTAIEHILEQLERVVPYDSASVQLLRDGYVEIVGGRGWADNRTVIGLRFPVPGDNPNSLVIEERRPHILQDAPRAHAPFRDTPHDHIHSWLGVPLFVHDRLIGMLVVDKKEPGYYQESHLELVTAFADQVAIAIENARLYSAVQQRITELEALRATAADITAELDQPKLLRSILMRATSLLNAPSGDLALYDEDRQEIEVVVSHNLGKDYTGVRLALGEGAMGKVAQTHQPLFAENYQEWEGRSPQYQGAPLHAILAAPMLIRNRLVGVIGVGDSDPKRCFTPADLHLLTLFTQQAAIAVENARLFDETRRLAITDPLTNLYNRRGLFELGQHEIERFHRFHRPLAAIMLDIDHFKQVNDIYSHAVGDQVLRALAETCRANLREVDLLGRYGGEEFAILLPETDVQGAEQVAERLRHEIASAPVMTRRGPITVTVSLGVTGALNGSSELAVLLDRADTAMYAAKQAGRDRVVVR